MSEINQKQIQTNNTKSQHKPILASSLSKDAWYGNSKHSGAKQSFKIII